jgi:hypothetical protein
VAIVAPEVKPEDKAVVEEDTVEDDIETGVALPESIVDPSLIDEKVIASK